jgi:hypothetical protein
MGRKRSDKGGHRRAGGRAATPPDRRRREPAAGRREEAGSALAPARLLLTRLVRDGAIWKVYVATTAQAGGGNVVVLEFEGTGADQEKVQYSRLIDGPLLDALRSGAPVSRAALHDELELAVRGAV